MEETGQGKDRGGEEVVSRTISDMGQRRGKGQDRQKVVKEDGGLTRLIQAKSARLSGEMSKSGQSASRQEFSRAFTI